MDTFPATDAVAICKPKTVDVGHLDAMEGWVRPFTCEDGTRSAMMRMSEGQARAVAEALRAVARLFDQAEHRQTSTPSRCFIELAIGEQGYIAAAAALRATRERQPVSARGKQGIW